MGAQQADNTGAGGPEGGALGRAPIEPVSSEAAQARVLAFLASPANFGGTAPTHVETHVSHVLVGTERALKLIRARKLPFLDGTDPDNRRAIIGAGLSLNRRTAPEIYRGVLTVSMRPNGALALTPPGDAAEGAVLDYVLHMRAFDQAKRLDRLLDAGALSPALIDRAADRIAAMHRTAPIRRVRDGALQARTTIDQIVRDLEAMAHDPVLARRVDGWAAAARAMDRRHAGLLDRRGRHGFVRRCHGDLHLANLCLWDSEPVPFDALEFDERLGTIDIEYDLAFLLMDLAHRGEDGLANRLLCRWLEWTRDYSGLALVPLFASMRAMVRALVDAAAGADPFPHITLAGRLLVGPVSPRLVAVGGQSGTGKSTLARALAERAGAVVLRSDAIRKHLYGKAPEERLPPEAYTEAVSQRVYRRMRADARRALGAGYPVILDGTFLNPAERAAAIAIADGAGVGFDGLWLTADAATLEARLVARAAKGTNASDADVAVMRAQAQAAARIPEGWHHLDASSGARPLVGPALAKISLRGEAR